MMKDDAYETFEHFDFITFDIYFSGSFVRIIVMCWYCMCPNIGKNLEYLNI